MTGPLAKGFWGAPGWTNRADRLLVKANETLPRPTLTESISPHLRKNSFGNTSAIYPHTVNAQNTFDA